MNRRAAALCLCWVCTCVPAASHGQESFRANEPCTDALLLSLKGRYREESAVGVESFSSSVAAADVAQLKNRLQVVRQLVEGAIPPAGLEPFWKMMGGQYRFAHDSENDNGFPTLRASYINYIQYYSCWGDDPNYVAYSGETGTTLIVQFNAMSSMRAVRFGPGEDFLIDGRPVYQRAPVVGRWKGRDLYASCELEQCRQRSVLLHRPGTNPYLPVTRGQYLEFCSAYVQQFGVEEFTDKFRKELARTADDGLLQAPAIVREACSILPDVPLFAAPADGGGELVTENPAYFREDLPRYMPQLIWVQWSWNDSAAPRTFRTVFEESFPIEQLQELIDR